MTQQNSSAAQLSGKPSLRETIRSQALAARQALTAFEHARRSEHLEARLDSFRQEHPAVMQGVIAAYSPFRAEFNPLPLLARWLQDHAGLKVVLPVVRSPQQPLHFRSWQPGVPMERGSYGIEIPATGPWLQPDLLLVPLNAFDNQGYRLGYGSGYYDRTLASLQPRPLTLGLGFELGRVASIQPASHDIPLDAILTERSLEVHSNRLKNRLKNPLAGD